MKPDDREERTEEASLLRGEEYDMIPFFTQMQRERHTSRSLLESIGYNSRYSEEQKHQHILDYIDLIFQGGPVSISPQLVEKDRFKILSSAEYISLKTRRNNLFTQKKDLMQSPLLHLYDLYLLRLERSWDSFKRQITVSVLPSFIIYLDVRNSLDRCEEILAFAQNIPTIQKDPASDG